MTRNPLLPFWLVAGVLLAAWWAALDAGVPPEAALATSERWGAWLRRGRTAPGRA